MCLWRLWSHPQLFWYILLGWTFHPIHRWPMYWEPRSQHLVENGSIYSTRWCSCWGYYYYFSSYNYGTSSYVSHLCCFLMASSMSSKYAPWDKMHFCVVLTRFVLIIKPNLWVRKQFDTRFHASCINMTSPGQNWTFNYWVLGPSKTWILLSEFFLYKY